LWRFDTGVAHLRRAREDAAAPAEHCAEIFTALRADHSPNSIKDSPGN
jgi:hypothetical protein